MAANQLIYLVDASIYIFRAYFSLPDEWQSPRGEAINALYGYTRFILKLLQQAKPEQIAVAYDESLGNCFRNDIYAQYKTSRALPDEALALQLKACKQLTQTLGIYSPASERYEADDLIAAMAHRGKQQGSRVAIVTRDKDLGQLVVSESDYLWDFASDKRIFRRDFIEHFHVLPEQLTDYLALVGDSVDDIPGVPGIGKKTASSLLNRFGSIDTMLENIYAVADTNIRGARKIAEKLTAYAEQIHLAKSLVELKTDLPLGDAQLMYWHPPSREALEVFLAEYGLEHAFKNQLDSCYWWS